MALVSNTDIDTPLTDDQARRAEQLNPLLRRTIALRRIAQLEANMADALDSIGELANGVVAYNEFAYTVIPTDTKTITIDGLVFEFCTAAGSVALDANIAVKIEATSQLTWDNLVNAINATDANNAHATLFKTDGTTPALANSTKNLLAVKVAGGGDTGTIYVYNADAPGGTKVEGAAPSMAFSDDIVADGPWKWSNLNLSTGAGFAGTTKAIHIKEVIAAGDLTATQPLLIPIPFAAQSFSAQVRNAAGVLVPRYVGVTVPAAIGTQNFLGLDVAPTAPTTLQSQIVTVPLLANATSIGAYSLPDGAQVVSIYARRGASALASVAGGVTLAVKNAAGTTMLNAATIDAEALTDTLVTQTVTGTPANLTFAPGAVGTVELVSDNPDATGECAIVKINYYIPVIATDVIHIDCYGA